VSDNKIYPLEPVSGRMRVEEVRQKCYEELLSHYPIADGGIFKGVVRCEDLEEAGAADTLSQVDHLWENIYVTDNATDWTRLFSKFLSEETNILPVIDRDHHYKGVYLLEDLLEELSEIKAFAEDGVVIRLQRNPDDFKVSQVAQVVEATGGKILGILLVDETRDHVTADIKVQTRDLNEILQTLRRYDYFILSRHAEDRHLQELKENAEYLERYLRMGE